MRSKLLKIILITFFFSNLTLNYSYSDEFEFTAKDLEVLNKDLIIGKNGAKIISKNQIITAEKFRYKKTNLHLELKGNVKIIDNLNNIIINADRIDYYKQEEKLLSEGNVKIIDNLNNTIINSDKIEYYKKDGKILSNGFAQIKYNDTYFIDSQNLTYFLTKKHFFSKNKTTFKDKTGNTFELDNFDYFELKDQLRGKNLKFTDTQSNKYYIDDAMINLKKNIIIGKDIKIDFVNSTFRNEENEPRLKGNKIYINKEVTTVSKGIFTTCKKNDSCPPWTMQANEIKHDKVKKIINYKNAWLKIYDKPVLYFPKFFHPDPTVKRQSGFLIPKLTDTNTLGSAVEIPYFKVIANNKDATFKPRLYGNGSSIIQSEYRQEKAKSSHILDFSIFSKENFDFFGKNSRKNHFFSNSKFNYDFKNFDDAKVELNIETTSNDTYLKTYKIESPLIKNQSSLNSFVNLELDNENTYIKTSFESYENLDRKKSERYEFIYPNIELLKEININPDYKGTLSFDLNGYQKKYNSDSNDTVLINNLEYESFDYINKNGIKNKFNILLKNVNTNGYNSNVYREDSANKFLSSFIFESSYPLKKQGQKFNTFLKPKTSIRYSPSETRNLTNADRRIDISNIFSSNRIAENSAVEGGESITIGSEYKITDIDNNHEYLLFNLASVFRAEENVDLPLKSTIGKKTSDIMGNVKFTPKKYFNIDYNFSLDNNLDSSNYDSIKTNLSVNNFVTSFEFLQEQGIIGHESYIQNETSYTIDDSNSLTFSTRRNKENNLTEFYNLIYKYKNDCLTAAVQYNKEYYTDNDLKPEEQLLFTITIMPFGKANSPNLNR
jgi:LPS-assembly protein